MIDRQIRSWKTSTHQIYWVVKHIQIRQASELTGESSMNSDQTNNKKSMSKITLRFTTNNLCQSNGGRQTCARHVVLVFCPTGMQIQIKTKQDRRHSNYRHYTKLCIECKTKLWRILNANSKHEHSNQRNVSAVVQIQLGITETH